MFFTQNEFCASSWFWGKTIFLQPKGTRSPLWEVIATVLPMLLCLRVRPVNPLAQTILSPFPVANNTTSIGQPMKGKLVGCEALWGLLRVFWSVGYRKQHRANPCLLLRNPVKKPKLTFPLDCGPIIFEFFLIRKMRGNINAVISQTSPAKYSYFKGSKLPG